MRISCLHTDAEDIPYYEAVTPNGVTLSHFLRPDIRLRAGSTSDAEGLAAEVGAQLYKMREGADAVLAASTMLAPHAAPPARSADALLAEVIAQRGARRRVEVFHSNPLTASVVTRIYGAIPGTAGMTVTILPDAWEAFVRGDRAGHAHLLRNAIDRSQADLIALVHPAMTPAADLGPRVLSAAHVALRQLAQIGAGTRQHQSVA